MSLETQIKAMEIRIEAARGRPRTKANIKALEEITKSLYNLRAQKNLQIKTV